MCVLSWDNTTIANETMDTAKLCKQEAILQIKAAEYLQTANCSDSRSFSSSHGTAKSSLQPHDCTRHWQLF